MTSKLAQWWERQPKPPTRTHPERKDPWALIGWAEPWFIRRFPDVRVRYAVKIVALVVAIAVFTTAISWASGKMFPDDSSKGAGGGAVMLVSASTGRSVEGRCVTADGKACTYDGAAKYLQNRYADGRIRHAHGFRPARYFAKPAAKQRSSRRPPSGGFFRVLLQLDGPFGASSLAAACFVQVRGRSQETDPAKGRADPDSNTRGQNAAILVS